MRRCSMMPCVSMFKQLTSTLNREGNGWNTAKPHSGFLHVARLVSAFGRPTNCDAEVGERGLKGWAINLAKHTNKGNTASFQKQVGDRVYESLIMARTSHAINADLEDDNDEEVEECNVRPGMLGLTKYLISFQKNFTDQDNQAHFGMCIDWKGKKEHKGVAELPLPVSDAFRDVFFNPDHTIHTDLLSTEIHGHTEYVSLEGKGYRAHPNYHDNGSWHDWAVIPCPNNNNDYLRNPHPGLETMNILFQKKALQGQKGKG